MKSKDSRFNKSSSHRFHPSSFILHPFRGPSSAYEFFLAFRYLRSRRKHRLVRFTVVAAVLGIACGVGALIVALALANGFRDEIRDKILRGTAHITASRRDGLSITNWREQATRMSGLDGVASISATSYDGALVAGTDHATYAVLRGVDTENAQAIGELRRVLIHGELNLRAATEATAQLEEGGVDDAFLLPTAIIGADLAARTNLGVGDVAKIISASATLIAPESIPQQRRVRIAGIFRTGLFEYDATWVYLSLEAASGLTGEALSASALSIETKDPELVAEVAERVRARLGDGFTVIDWREANRPLFAALTLERRVILAVIALIVLIAALNIATSLALLVVERRPDIAILAAVGARPLNIMIIFLLEGALIGAIGAATGVALGLCVAYVGNRYQLISLPADVYSISSVPFHVEWRDVSFTALSAFALSLLATIYPAQAAARVRPAEALRYE